MNGSMQLEISGPGRQPQVHEVGSGAYTVGSDEDNKLVLPDPAVSAKHAVLFLSGNGCWVEDLDSASGTFVDGRRVRDRTAVEPGQKVAIGPFILVSRLSGDTAVQPAPPAAQAAPARDASPVETAVPKTAAGGSEQRRLIKAQIHEELVKRLNIKRLTVSKVGEEDLRKRAEEMIATIVGEVSTRLPQGVDPQALAKEVRDEAVGLGPLEDLLADPEITEIMVNGPDNVFVEKQGKLVCTGMTFMSDASVHAIIERIVSPLGRRIDESQPYVDARLKDGSRVNAIIHPLSLVGPCITIRKFSKKPFTDRDLIRFGSMAPMMTDFASACVAARKNIVISGGTGSGKTSLLNVFSQYLPSGERILTIEDAAELRLTQAHVIRLEARPPNIEGRGAITIRDLVRNSLRMRPDRIVVGECRGGEALDMLQAMNTGHDGSLTTVHANSPRDVISRLETMVLMSGMELPVRAIREQIASAINIIFHIARLADGTRKIVSVCEIVGLEGDKITMQELFKYVQVGVGDDGRVIGNFAPCGTVPTFVEELERKGIALPRGMFDPRKWGG